ncbi:recombinase family protein [Oceanicola granulosus]|uniref:recombinase family protein n=1 Tax=Oceanicola granulosus TaxID=252302 RepID=UPI00315D4BF8
MKAEADRLGLRSRKRTRADGRVAGGTFFDRGHIHHVLTNPLHAGRIRHRGEVHAGQHPAIIAPERWEPGQGIRHPSLSPLWQALRRDRRPADAVTLEDPGRDPVALLRLASAGREDRAIASRCMEAARGRTGEHDRRARR